MHKQSIRLGRRSPQSAIGNYETLEPRRFLSVASTALIPSLVQGTQRVFDLYLGPDESKPPTPQPFTIGPQKQLGAELTTRIDSNLNLTGITQYDSIYVSNSSTLGYREFQDEASSTVNGAVSSSVDVYSPAFTTYPAQMVAGVVYTYPTTITQTQYRNGVFVSTSSGVLDTYTVELTSEKLEQVTVPAGTFMAYKLLTSHTSLVNGKPFVKNGIEWCVPTIGNVKTVLSVAGTQTSLDQLRSLTGPVSQPAPLTGSTSPAVSGATITALPIGGTSPITTTTASDGTYHLQLPAGQYIVTASGTGFPTPVRAVDVTIGTDGVTSDFRASDAGTVRGFVFNDLNHNGVLDAGESGIGGALVYIDTHHDGKRNRNEVYARTSSTGAYALRNVMPGSFRIREQLPAGYTLLAPHAGFYTASVRTATTLSGRNFADEIVDGG